MHFDLAVLSVPLYQRPNSTTIYFIELTNGRLLLIRIFSVKTSWWLKVFNLKTILIDISSVLLIKAILYYKEYSGLVACSELFQKIVS